MSLPSWHVHVSEREPDGTWEDCTFDSGLEWYRLCHDRSKPATHAEAQAIRNAAGLPQTGGGTIADLRRGIKARYGKDIPTGITGWTTLWSALKPGTAAVVQGSMKAFGSTHRLSRWDKNFDGGHAVMCIRLDSTDRVWWCDPLAPTGTYKGEWVTKAELQKYVTGLAGWHLVAPLLPEPVPVMEEDMILSKNLPGYRITVIAGSNIRKDPSLKNAPWRKTTAVENWTIIGAVAGEKVAPSLSPDWFVRWTGTRWEYIHKNGVSSGPIAPLAQADVDKAVAAAVAPLNAKIAAAKTALGG